jgi:hypothetical protein
MKYHAWIAFPLALTYAIIGLQGIGTIWDCSNLLYFSLDTGRPFIAFDRYTDSIFGWSVIIAHRFTDDVRLLEACFAITHLSVTLLAWILSAYLLRWSSDTPRLVAALMILAIPLPGQAYVCTDINHVSVMAPVLVVLAAGPMNRKRLALFAVISTLSFLDHPGSLFVFALVTIVIAAKWRFECRFGSLLDRLALSLTALLLGASLWRFAFGLTEYEKAEMQLATTVLHFRLGLFGLPGILVVLVYVAAAAILVGRVDAAACRSAAWGWVAIGALLVGAACIVSWAADPSRWIHGDTYRKFTLLLNIPIGALLAGALFLERRHVRASSGGQTRELASAAFGIILFMHAGCLFIQSTNYAQLRARLKDELLHARSGLVFLTDRHWAFMTPLRIWALPINSILLQGRTPTAMASFTRPEDTVFDPRNRIIRFGKIPEVSIAGAGWFQFERLLQVEPEAELLKSAASHHAEQSQRPERLLLERRNAE